MNVEKIFLIKMIDNTVNLNWKIKNKTTKHHFLIPSPSLRALICGASGCGKTNLLLKLLLTNNILDYTDLHIFSKSLHQPEYKLLKAAFNKGYSKSDVFTFLKEGQGDMNKFIKELPIKGKPVIKVTYYDSSDDIPDPNEMSCSRKSLFVFDDIMLERKQSKVEDFYTRGRHNNCSSIYISQNYHKLPRQTIRSNSNCIILFSLPKKDIQNIHQDLLSNDMDFKEFKDYFSNLNQYSYIVINKEHDIFDGKYLKNFNEIYIPKKHL